MDLYGRSCPHALTEMRFYQRQIVAGNAVAVVAGVELPAVDGSEIVDSTLDDSVDYRCLQNRQRYSGPQCLSLLHRRLYSRHRIGARC